MNSGKCLSTGPIISAFVALALTLGIGISPGAAQQRVDIRFNPGATSTTINGTIRGNEYIDYVLNARSGQTMVVSLAVTGTNGNGSAYFNILPAGQDYPALFNGSMEGGRAEATLPSSGDWAIRVYLMGNDRDAGKTVGYSIDVYIAPGGGRASSGGGESQAGGGYVPEEDIFIVTLANPGGYLNIHSGPSTGAPILGRFPDGVTLRNAGGCQYPGGQQWCDVEAPGGGVRGWVAGEFLTVPGAGGAPSGGTAVQLPSLPPQYPAGGDTGTVRVQFQSGATGAEYTGTLSPGSSTRYVLNARDGQDLYVRVATGSPVVSYQIFNPDRSFLLDQMTAAQEYRGQLWQTGDHVVEVINRGSSQASYNVIFGIQ